MHPLCKFILIWALLSLSALAKSEYKVVN
jgi:hypothetical protein